MDIIESMRENATAVYWPLQKDDQGRPMLDSMGSPKYDVPKELSPDGPSGGVYCMDSTEVITKGNGDQYNSRAKVFVGEDIDEQGILRMGTLADIPNGYEDTPLRLPRVSQVQRFDKIPVLEEGEEPLRIAWL